MCNVNIRQTFPIDLPVASRNLKIFDAYLFLNEPIEEKKKTKVNFLAESDELLCFIYS